MRRRRRRILPRADINVTPLIDILLVLLVIFMTISPSEYKGLYAAIPQQPPRPVAEDRKTIVLSIDRNGNLRINREPVELPLLNARLREVFKSRSDRTAFIQADRDLLFNDVARLIDMAKGAGVERFGLITDELAAK